MKFQTKIIWIKRFYRLLEKLRLEEKFFLDDYLDYNFPDIVSKLQDYIKEEKIALCATSGKRTLTNIFCTILKQTQKTYVSNISYDAKIRPLYTSIILNFARGLEIFLQEKKDYCIAAVGENDLYKYFSSMKFDCLLLHNLFLDQKDNLTLEEKKQIIKDAIVLNTNLALIINADDANFYHIDDIKNDPLKSRKRKKFYYGFDKIEFVDEEYLQKNDFQICPKCSCALEWHKRFYSHLGEYSCDCGFKRPKLDVRAEAKIYKDYCFLNVFYKDNKYVFRFNEGNSISAAYNALGAIALAIYLKIERKIITSAFENYDPFFGRGKIIKHRKENIKIKLIVNPTSMSDAIYELWQNTDTKVLFLLDDKQIDGVDTSWIWDSNLKVLKTFENKIFVSGKRFEDMALRLKYAGVNPSLINMEENIKTALICALYDLRENENLLILTVPSLMDEVVDILEK